VINLQNVTKDFGKTVALNSFSLKAETPGIYCLLGRNGAGKTTMLKLLAGHIEATSGTVSVNKKTVNMLNMPQDLYFVESTAAQFNAKLDDLFLYASQINSEFDLPFAESLAKRFELDTTKRYKHLSFGMKAMVNTIIALSSGKEILLLDEPVLGFDPVMRKTFYDMLFEANAEKSKTVIVSTHIIDEISKVAEKLIIIDKGRLVLYTDIAEIDEKAYSVTGPLEAVKKATDGLNIIGETNVGGFLSRNIYDKRIDGSENISVTSLGLTEFFVSLVGNERSVN
jgi:ABC-2 type transport system ATP-binding protein